MPTLVTPYSISGTAIKILNKNPKRTSFFVKNNSGSTIFLITAQNQTVADGLPILTTLTFTDEHSKDEVWAISSGSNLDIRVWETSD